jgi:hypothetical protein
MFAFFCKPTGCASHAISVKIYLDYCRTDVVVPINSALWSHEQEAKFRAEATCLDISDRCTDVLNSLSRLPASNSHVLDCTITVISFIFCVV